MKWELVQDIMNDYFLHLEDKNGDSKMLKITDEEAEILKEGLELEVFRIPF